MERMKTEETKAEPELSDNSECEEVLPNNLLCASIQQSVNAGFEVIKRLLPPDVELENMADHHLVVNENRPSMLNERRSMDADGGQGNNMEFQDKYAESLQRFQFRIDKGPRRNWKLMPETPEDREEKKRKAREKKRRQRARIAKEETAEDREEKKRKQRERKRSHRLRQSSADREEERTKGREHIRIQRSRETPADQEERRRRAREWKQKQRHGVLPSSDLSRPQTEVESETNDAGLDIFEIKQDQDSAKNLNLQAEPEQCVLPFSYYVSARAFGKMEKEKQSESSTRKLSALDCVTCRKRFPSYKYLKLHNEFCSFVSEYKKRLETRT